jgi:hypothetical protein
VQTNANSDSCDTFYNIYLDPLFVDFNGGDYHLTEESPCIDAGDPAFALDPDGTITDMGAFYYDQTVCGDANGDGGMTSGDGYQILNHFGDPVQFPISSCWAANVNGDGALTTADGYHALNYLGDPISFPLDCQPCE